MDEDKADELYRLFQSVDQAAKHKRGLGFSSAAGLGAGAEPRSRQPPADEPEGGGFIQQTFVAQGKAKPRPAAVTAAEARAAAQEAARSRQAVADSVAAKLAVKAAELKRQKEEERRLAAGSLGSEKDRHAPAKADERWQKRQRERELNQPAGVARHTDRGNGKAQGTDTDDEERRRGERRGQGQRGEGGSRKEDRHGDRGSERTEHEARPREVDQRKGGSLERHSSEEPDKHTDGRRGKERVSDRARGAEMGRERDGERGKEREREREGGRDRARDKQRESGRDRERQRDREGDRVDRTDRDREGSRYKDEEGSRAGRDERDRHRTRERDADRHRNGSDRDQQGSRAKGGDGSRQEAAGGSSRDGRPRGVQGAAAPLRPAAPDYALLIPGYDAMGPAEKLKARTRLALSRADGVSRKRERDELEDAVREAGRDGDGGDAPAVQRPWTRFVFDSTAPLEEDRALRPSLTFLEDREGQEGEGDAAAAMAGPGESGVEEGGALNTVSFRQSGKAATRKELDSKHEAAIFGGGAAAAAAAEPSQRSMPLRGISPEAKRQKQRKAEEQDGEGATEGLQGSGTAAAPSQQLPVSTAVKYKQLYGLGDDEDGPVVVDEDEVAAALGMNTGQGGLMPGVGSGQTFMGASRGSVAVAKGGQASVAKGMGGDAGLAATGVAVELLQKQQQGASWRDRARKPRGA